MVDEKLKIELSDEKLKMIDNSEFVKITKKVRPDDIYIPITKNGKKAFLVVKKD